MFDYLGIRFFVTSNARVFTTAGLSLSEVYATMLIGNEAYGVSELDAQNGRIFYKGVGSAGHVDPIDQLWSVKRLADIKLRKLGGSLSDEIIPNQAYAKAA